MTIFGHTKARALVPATAGAIAICLWAVTGSLIAVAVLLAACGLAALEGWARSERRRAGERAYAESQRELSETIQAARGEDEAHGILKAHLERALPGAGVTVMAVRDESRLEATTGLEEGSPLAERLPAPDPNACLAVRLAKTHERDGGRPPLLACGVCGAVSGPAACVPLVVGGDVTGSLLVTRTGHERLDEDAQRRVHDSVAQSVPVLAHLRSRALAETRAAIDALTGLPNSRALRDALRRMIAQAGRTLQPLSVILLDVDHFKKINETHGHDRGDDALAAVGDVLSSTVRSSDFAGRFGGEEFLVLLPATDREGAVLVAEKLREAIGALVLPGVERPLSASFGVASLPGDGGTADSLVRLADRALHAAKASGRNRVQVAGLSVAPDPEA